MEKEWQEECTRVDGNREPEATTAAGIPVKPVYGPSDIDGIDLREIGMPGLYPYTRGTHPLQYQFRPWSNQFGLGYGLPDDTRKRS